MTVRLLRPAGDDTRRAARCGWCAADDVEFGWYSAALGQVLGQATRPDVRLAAACRGSGDRPVLGHLAAALDSAPSGAPVVDVGAGLGGPGAWLQERTGRRFVGVEPSLPSVRVARGLFPDLPVVPGDAAALPVADGVAGAVTMIGVLSLLGSARNAALAEARRALRPGGVLALTDVVAPQPADRRDADLPEGTEPPLAGRVTTALTAAGWIVLDSGLDDSPRDEEWATLREDTDDLVTAHVRTTPHGVDHACPHAWEAERDARHRMWEALDSGQLRRETVIARWP
jgi:SAM-dependent methyltransferase